MRHGLKTKQNKTKEGWSQMRVSKFIRLRRSIRNEKTIQRHKNKYAAYCYQGRWKCLSEVKHLWRTLKYDISLGSIKITNLLQSAKFWWSRLVKAVLCQKCSTITCRVSTQNGSHLNRYSVFIVILAVHAYPRMHADLSLALLPQNQQPHLDWGHLRLIKELVCEFLGVQFQDLWPGPKMPITACNSEDVPLLITRLWVIMCGN